MNYYSKKSLDILSRAHEDLQKLFLSVGEEIDCSIVCSTRGEKEQEEAFNNNYSKAHFGQSPHNFIPALAVDCVPYPSKYSDIQKLKDLGAAIQIKAIELGIQIEWGGNWVGFRDYPHYQLKNWKQYSAIKYKE